MRACFRFLYEFTIIFLIRLRLVKSLKIVCGEAGFFGELFTTLNGLRFAEKVGINASVFWGERSCYYEKTIGSNVWKYYFENDFYCFAKRSPSRFSFSLSYKPSSGPFASYPGLSVRRSLALAIENWCVLNKKCRLELERALGTINSKSHVIGVHIRMTDVLVGFEGRKNIKFEHYINVIEEYSSQFNVDAIFLATDDANCVSLMAERFGNLLVFRDCLRSSDGISLHGHYDSGVNGSGFDKGLDVLLDACILSRVDFLIRTHSRVTAYSICVNPSLNYIDLERLLTGVDRTPWIK